MASIRKRRFAIVLVLLLAVSAFGVWRWVLPKRDAADSLRLYGNIDIREVQLSFNDSDRIDEMLVEEGSVVHAGELLARLSEQRYADAVGQDQGRVGAQQEVLARLLAGSRPEEIATARAEVSAARAEMSAAEANLTNAELLYRRRETLARQQYISLQLRDDAERSWLAAKAALEASRQVLTAKEQALRLALIGPRKEDIAAARATLRSATAALALAEKKLGDTRLYAPAGGVIQNRILEPGDMASPATPVFTLALDNPVWARVYLPEPEMGRVVTGMRAWIESDSFPGEHFSGWVGFVSPVAEFTPKNVETTQLRSQLVYRVRVYACNPEHRLRLGMPVTVILPLRGNSSHGVDASPCETK